MKKIKTRRVLCPVCKKPVLKKEFGGVAKQEDGSVGVYHSKCIIASCLDMFDDAPIEDKKEEECRTKRKTKRKS